MDPDKILQNQKHRLWKPPSNNWKFYQEWKDVIFLYWEVDKSKLEKFVPKELIIDTFQDKAWISILAFKTKGVRMRGTLSFPPLSTFHEVNIRTYIKTARKNGIYFLNLEASKLLSSVLTKVVTALPYYYSKIESTDTKFKCENLRKKNYLNVEYQKEEASLEKEKLDSWLTERYVAFQDIENDIIEFNIHHLEWPLKKVNINKTLVNYPLYNELLKGAPTKVHYSPGVEVLIWEKYKWNIST